LAFSAPWRVESCREGGGETQREGVGGCIGVHIRS
jgi:hypothetical protein